MNKRKYAIIVAGGVGHRAGGSIPKQFQPVLGTPMLWWSVKAFYDEDPSTTIILVLHPDYVEMWQELETQILNDAKKAPKVKIALGGADRLQSVRNGLLMVEEPGLIAVHDAARPMVSRAMISQGWQVAEETGTAIPVVPVTDSLRHIEGTQTRAVVRSEYVAVQTPQVFRSELLIPAYERELTSDMTDDAPVVEAAGVEVATYAGEPTNIKVTNPLDFAIAEILLKRD